MPDSKMPYATRVEKQDTQRQSVTHVLPPDVDMTVATRNRILKESSVETLQTERSNLTEEVHGIGWGQQ